MTAENQLIHMKNLVFIALIFMTLEVFGQNHLIGITGSVNRTNTRSDIFRSYADPRLGISGGITYEYFLKKRFSIGADVVYIRQGFRSNFETPDGQQADYQFHYDYLSVPLKAAYTKFNEETNFLHFAKVGLVPSFLVNAETTLPVFNEAV